MASREMTRWETLVSDVPSLATLSVFEEGGPLIVTVGDTSEPPQRFQFTFLSVFAYRRLREEYLTSSWPDAQQSLGLGWTRKIESSSWISALIADEPIFVLDGGARALHLMLCTEDAVLEVLTKAMPDVVRIQSVSA